MYSWYIYIYIFLYFSKTMIVASGYLDEPNNFRWNDPEKKQYFFVRYSGCAGLFSGTPFLPERFHGLVDTALKPALIKFRGVHEFYLI